MNTHNCPTSHCPGEVRHESNHGDDATVACCTLCHTREVFINFCYYRVSGFPTKTADEAVAIARTQHDAYYTRLFTKAGN